MDGVHIYERLLPDAAADEVERALLAPDFPWYFAPNTSAPDTATRPDDAPQMVHGLWAGGQTLSKAARYALGVAGQVGAAPAHVLRAKANLLLPDGRTGHHLPHTDDARPHWALVYAVTDSDGDTVFFRDGEVACRVPPRRGGAVLFDGRLLHASSSPTRGPRVVLNLNIDKAAPIRLPG